MKKSLVIFGLLVAAIFFAGTLFLSEKKGDEGSPLSASAENTNTLPDHYEYYWGDGCPHCKIVEDFLSTWDKKDQVNIEELEVWSSPQNARKMTSRANYCKIPQKELAVPFLFTPSGECLKGDEPIINYFKSLFENEQNN